MLTTEDVEAWLAKVASLRLDTAQLKRDAKAIEHNVDHLLVMTDSYLEDVFIAGLQAYGDAVLAAHLGKETSDVA
jgi:hypothetical protein